MNKSIYIINNKKMYVNNNNSISHSRQICKRLNAKMKLKRLKIQQSKVIKHNKMNKQL